MVVEESRPKSKPKAIPTILARLKGFPVVTPVPLVDPSGRNGTKTKKNRATKRSENVETHVTRWSRLPRPLDSRHGPL